MPSILFVCTANRFRSPLAAGIFRQSLVEKSVAGSWQIGSAGTWATPGKPVIPPAAQAAQELGFDLSGHRSTEVSAPLLSMYDLILVMQAGQKEALLTEFPQLQQSIHLLSEVAENRAYDIPDVGRTDEETVQLAHELDGLIRGGLNRICVLALQLNYIRQRTELTDGSRR